MIFRDSDLMLDYAFFWKNISFFANFVYLYSYIDGGYWNDTLGWTSDLFKAKKVGTSSGNKINGTFPSTAQGGWDLPSGLEYYAWVGYIPSIMSEYGYFDFCPDYYNPYSSGSSDKKDDDSPPPFDPVTTAIIIGAVGGTTGVVAIGLIAIKNPDFFRNKFKNKNKKKKKKKKKAEQRSERDDDFEDKVKEKLKKETKDKFKDKIKEQKEKLKNEKDKFKELKDNKYIIVRVLGDKTTIFCEPEQTAKYFIIIENISELPIFNVSITLQAPEKVKCMPKFNNIGALPPKRPKTVQLKVTGMEEGEFNLSASVLVGKFPYQVLPLYLKVRSEKARKEICKKCGTINELSSEFCNKCGAYLTKDVIESIEQGIRCQICGIMNEFSSKLCRKCGKELVKKIVREVSEMIDEKVEIRLKQEDMEVIEGESTQPSLFEKIYDSTQEIGTKSINFLDLIYPITVYRGEKFKIGCLLAQRTNNPLNVEVNILYSDNDTKEELIFDQGLLVELLPKEPSLIDFEVQVNKTYKYAFILSIINKDDSDINRISIKSNEFTINILPLEEDVDQIDVFNSNSGKFLTELYNESKITEMNILKEINATLQQLNLSDIIQIKRILPQSQIINEFLKIGEKIKNTSSSLLDNLESLEEIYDFSMPEILLDSITDIVKEFFIFTSSGISVKNAQMLKEHKTISKAFELNWKLMVLRLRRIKNIINLLKVAKDKGYQIDKYLFYLKT